MKLSFPIALCLAVAALAAQSEPPSTFRSGIDIVRLDVSVLDKDRMPVRGLTAADFTVLEDGKPQPIVAFDAVDVPDYTASGAAWMRDVAPDVVTNHFGAQRVIVILIKDVRVPLDPWSMNATKRIARDVVERMGPKDLAAVVYTFNRDKGQEFTADRARLLAAIERFSVAFADQQLIANPNSASERGPQSDRMANANTPLGPPPTVCPGDDCVTQALRNAAEILRDSPEGRKTLILVSPALRRFPVMSMEMADQNDDLARTFAAMQQANINVYQFDPRGLQVAAPGPLEDAQIFADNTGGRAITQTNAPWTLVPQVFRENSSYYLLGFRSTNAAVDRRFRHLQVRVNRPDLNVRTRSGYFVPRLAKASRASSRAPASPLEAAIGRGMPTGDLAMDLTVAPFASSRKGTGALAIVAGLDRPAALSAKGTLDVIATAFDDLWKQVETRTQKLEIAEIDPSGPERHYDLAWRLDLPPGRYEIRVAADSRATDRTGSAFASVTIPNFDKQPLSLSGVVLEHGAAESADASGPLAGLVPIAPTTIREFMKSERVSSFVRIYQGGKTPAIPVRINARIVDESDRTVEQQSATLSPTEFAGDRSVDYRYDLPLARLSPGAYLFTIEATGGALSARRDVRFSIK